MYVQASISVFIPYIFQLLSRNLYHLECSGVEAEEQPHENRC